MASLKQELLGLYLDSSGDSALPFANAFMPGQSPQPGSVYASWSRTGPGDGQRRHRHHHRGNQQQRIAALQARAATGDQAAITKLQTIQQRLSTELSTINNPAAPGTPAPYIPGVTPPPSPSGPPLSSYISPRLQAAAASTTYPPPPPVPTAYPTAQPQYAYQSPYYDPTTMNPYDPPPPAPTIDVYQGDSLGREEAAALAGDGGATERAALGRCGWYGNTFVGASDMIGNAIPHENYRIAVMKAAVKSAGGGKPTTKDFVAAKSAVDKVIGKAGITIYMPGAKPGRRTI